MQKQLILLIVLFIFPFGFYYYFANKEIPRVRQLKHYIPLPNNSTQPNQIKINDTIWHTIPPFTFIGQNGKPITEKNFNNKIYVANFFFTNCPGICPKMSTQMQRIQKVYDKDNDIMLLSHTVDPKRDTVEALLNYANSYEIDSSKWWLVTGNKTDLYEQARKGYFVSVTEGDGGEEDFIHTEKLVLVDKERCIRGYYDGTDSLMVNKLMGDIKLLQFDYEVKAQREKNKKEQLKQH